MPNWCDNFITLGHDDPSMLVRAKEALERGEFLQEFIPCPDDLTNTVSGNVGDPLGKENHQTREELNLVLYGYRNWYDFRVEEWGTKWDVGVDDGSVSELDDGTIQASFQSAWAPPTTAYAKLENLGFTVDAYYHEPGMAFCGHYVNGEDDNYEYGNMTSDEIEQEIPADINEMFAISDSVREYENEDSEE